MTKRTIRAGRTAFANGALAPGDVLSIQAGAPGAGAGGTGIVSTTLDNAGTIRIAGGAAGAKGQAGGQGGVLDVQGVLTDSGAITIMGGQLGRLKGGLGQGGTLSVSGTLSLTQTGSLTISGGSGGGFRSFGPQAPGGVLLNTGEVDNAGYLQVSGAGDPRYGFGTTGAGGSLANAGTLVNTGTLLVQGGEAGGFYTDAGQGATLTDTGVLTNAGTLMVTGGAGGGYLASGGTGGTLTVAADGVLTNTGSLLIGGGAVAYDYNYGTAGLGGVLADQGLLTNAGRIEIGAAVSKTYGRSGTGGELIDSGALTSTGTILVEGSQSSEGGLSGTGGLLSVSGQLTTSGLLAIAAGSGAPDRYSPPGLSGMLVDTGTLTNAGQLTLAGGPAGTGNFGYGSAGAVLDVTGTYAMLDNAGTLIVGGGQGSRFAGESFGTGGMVSVSGTLNDTGTLLLQAGTTGHGPGLAGTGASLDVSGRLSVSGSLTVAGAQPGGRDASLTVESTGGVRLDGVGVIENDGVVSLAAGSYVYGSYGQSLLINKGVISGSGQLSSTVIVNDGTIDAGSGQILLYGDTIRSDGAGGIVRVGDNGLLTIDRGTTLDASQTVVLAGATSEISLFGADSSAAGVLITSPDGGKLDIYNYPGSAPETLNAADTNLSVFLASAINLTLSRMSAIAVTGSSGADTITALSSGQTLTGAGGHDMLTGASATGDLFLDTALGLNGDTIADFAGTDAIDITDIASGAGLALSYTQQGDHGLLSVTNGSATTTITLQGSFTATWFATASDNHGGVQITLHG